MIVQELKEKIKQLESQITEIQSQCNHPTVCLNKSHFGSTGGYDTDTYWTEYECRLCEKKWTEDGNK